MFVGTFRGVRLSVEGLVVPVPLRPGLEQGFVATRGLDGCVAVYPRPIWEAVLQHVEQQASFLRGAARMFQRYVYGGATIGTLGSEGLIGIPEHLRTYAKLGDEVVVVGIATHLEVWNSQRWNEEESTVNKRAEEVAEALSEYGLLGETRCEGH
jgi:MraZ protein